MAERRPRGTGTVYQEGSRWAVRWQEGKARRRYAGGFKTREDAERHGTIARATYLAKGPSPVALVAGMLTLADHGKAFLERRKTTHEAGEEVAYRWNRHIAPGPGHLRPDEVDAAEMRRFIHDRLDADCSPGTVRTMVSILSGLYEELVEARLATRNPCRGLPKSTRRLMKSDHDPEDVPFLEKLDDVRRVYLAIRDQSEGLAVGFALGAFGGLRPGEAFGLRWRSVDLAGKTLHVREQAKKKRVKDGKPRVVPILDTLFPVLKAWKVKTGGQPADLVVPPLRIDGQKVDDRTRCDYLRFALEKTGLARPGFGSPPVKGEKPEKVWYWCTRHTFASHWVLQGNTIEVLSKILGHYSIVQTEVYAHLRPDLFGEKARGALPVDLSPEGATVTEIRQKFSQKGKTRCVTY